MSSMLEQSIIDAKQLKEAAQKNAEEALIEKYQDDIRNAVETILEQEDDFDLGDPTAETEMVVDDSGDLTFVDDLPASQKTDMDELVTIDLDKLEEMMEEEMENGGVDSSEMADREEMAEEISEEVEKIDEEEEIELDEALLESILEDELLELNEEELEKHLEEDLYMDTGDETEEAESSEATTLAGETEEGSGDLTAAGEGAKPSDTKNESLEEEAKPDFLDLDKDGDKKEPMKKAAKQAKKTKTNESRVLQKENKSLLKEQSMLNNKVQLLEEKVDKYGTVIIKLKEKLEESNLTNAKLLYQNRVLNSVSLNERQKDRIVEAISNAKSVEETKIIFETLQSAVGSVSKRKRPESLNEVVSRSSSAFISRKEDKSPKTNSFAERMRILAGIKKN